MVLSFVASREAAPVAIVGAGRLAQVVGRTLLQQGVPLRVWSRNREQAEAWTRGHAAASAHDDIVAACAGVPVIILAVPIAALRQVARRLAPALEGDQVILHGVRGVEPGFVLPHQVLRAETCVQQIGVLGGPIYPPELAAQRPMSAVLASRFAQVVIAARAVVRGTPLRLHDSRDVAGVEVAGAMSNVVRMALGMAAALTLDETARGLIMTRGLCDAAELAVSCGGEASTLMGLAGLGDLIPRPVATLSRHYDVGRQIAVASADAITHADAAGVDGLTTAVAATAWADRHGLAVPLVRAVAAVVTGEIPAGEALSQVLALNFDPGQFLAC